jgi:hypothetical protein
MGVIVVFEVESGRVCPHEFTTPARSLFEYVMEHQIGVGNYPNELGKIENHFKLNLLPITKMGTPEWELILEEFDMDETRFNQEREASIALWQPPEELINCVQSILKALHETPDVFSLLNISGAYFTKGFFEGNLVDLLKMLEWATENGEKKVRLIVG